MTWDLPNYSKVVNFANGKIGENFFPQVSVDIQESARANSFFVNSDERIKTNIHLLQQPDNLPDLYEYKYISNDKKELGFIAQYLENHHPNAIKTITDFIPNINSNVHTYDNILYNLNECSVGDKLLITVNGNKKEVSVVKVEEDHVYINENIGENIVYVYGKKVNDFKTIDKDYLFSLNFALTLKLLKSITELENEKNSI
jgi:hypothetical protein